MLGISNLLSFEHPHFHHGQNGVSCISCVNTLLIECWADCLHIFAEIRCEYCIGVIFTFGMRLLWMLLGGMAGYKIELHLCLLKSVLFVSTFYPMGILLVSSHWPKLLLGIVIMTIFFCSYFKPTVPISLTCLA